VKVYFFCNWFSLSDHTVGVPEVHTLTDIAEQRRAKTVCNTFQIEYPIVKYNPALPKWLKGYCVVHLLLLLCIFLHFEFDRDKLSYTEFALKMAFFVCTMQSFGAFFDLK